ncbi:hypothetical protein OH799_18160 [Nocardia sp. NBC_00881]|nr:hypothetical protein OH799_18160 [Nocardia sp. NBC_00881]
MDAVPAEAVERTELPTWEYGWGVTDGPGVPEGLFVENSVSHD